MEVDFSAFRSLWHLIFLDLMFYRNSDGIVFLQMLSLKLYVAVNWVFRCSLTSCFSISFWNFLGQIQCENSTLSDVRLRLFYVSFGKSVYRLLQRHRCRREHVVSVFNVRICSCPLCCDSVFATYLWLVVFTLFFDSSCTASLVCLLLNRL